jgi:hypothetical protein
VIGKGAVIDYTGTIGDELHEVLRSAAESGPTVTDVATGATIVLRHADIEEPQGSGLRAERRPSSVSRRAQKAEVATNVLTPRRGRPNRAPYDKDPHYGAVLGGITRVIGGDLGGLER